MGQSSQLAKESEQRFPGRAQAIGDLLAHAVGLDEPGDLEPREMGVAGGSYCGSLGTSAGKDTCRPKCGKDSILITQICGEDCCHKFSLRRPCTEIRAPASSNFRCLRNVMKVYLAARFSRLPEVVRYADELELGGIEVTSRWLRGGHEWVGTPDDDIPVEHLARFAIEALEDIDAADMVVCFTEAPRTGPARGGRHVEAGYALAKEMPILVVGYRENVFYCLPGIVFVETWAGALGFLRMSAAPEVLVDGTEVDIHGG